MAARLGAAGFRQITRGRVGEGGVTGTASMAIAVVAALVAAACFGLTGALQHVSTRRTREHGILDPGLLVDLVRQPLWMASLLVNGLGVALQWVALANGPLTLVQPLLVTGVLFGVLFSTALRGVRPDAIVLLGAVLCTGGLALFLVVAQPTAGTAALSPEAVLPFAAGLGVVLALCLFFAVNAPGVGRTLSLATAAGVLFGVTAGLAKLAIEDLQRGVPALFSDWPVYVMVTCGIVGFLLSQNAFQAGEALSPALAVIVVLDPLVGLGIGLLWLGETVRTGPAAILGELFGLAVMITGIAVLSLRAPQAARRVAQHRPAGLPARERAR